MILEPVVDVAKSALDGLKSQPALLALVLLAGGVFTATYFAVQNEQSRNHEKFIKVLERCVPLDKEKM